MTKSLVLHIGANKTGSSAIQTFLRLNSDVLPRFEIKVAASDMSLEGAVSGDQVFFIQSLLDNIKTGRNTLDKRLKQLMGRIPNGSTLLLSAENLANPNESPRLFAGAVKDYDVRLILYIRRQDEYLLSTWQQWNSKLTDDFWAWVLSVVGQLGNWRLCLQNWEQVIPREQITVRIYERARLVDHDVVADFIDALGLSDHKSEFKLPGKLVNPSYSEAVLDFVKGNRALFKNVHDNEFYRILGLLTGDKFVRNSRESVITHKQRTALLSRYAVSNTWIQTNYFPESEGDLFASPQENDYHYLTRDELEAQKWDLVATLIRGLAARVMREGEQ
jgi:hypothetical protein